MIGLSKQVARPAKFAGPKLLGLFRQLVECLHSEGVRYCHWKSNHGLLRAIGQGGDPGLLQSGELDLDLLVDRKHITRFEGVLALLGFKRTIDPVKPHSTSVLHFHGLDAATGALLHLHVYYRIVTGESLLKNYRLPLEELLLANARKVEGLPIVDPKVELIIFIIRMMVKYGSLAEQVLVGIDKKAVLVELESLLADGSQKATEGLIEAWLPGLSPALFGDCVTALRDGTSRVRRYLLGRRLRRQLASYRCFSRIGEATRRAGIFWQRLLWRLLSWSSSRQDHASGGAVIAFIGLDASGKSTLMRETAAWLGKVFRLDAEHLGKPPSAWLTLLPNLARRLVAWLAPHLRMSARQDGCTANSGSKGGLLYRLRMVMLAWDRRALALRLRRKAANGWIVLCDRYPSAQVGAIDGAALPLPAAGAGGGLKGYLALLENRLYRQIASPDIVIRVVAPAEVAVERNRQRHELGKEKSDSYVAYNHRNVHLPAFHGAHTVELDTNRSRADTVQHLRRILWQLL